MTKSRIALISTGGTIEKTYDELHGVLHNEFSVLDVMIASLQLEGIEIHRVPLLNMDSLDMTPVEHQLIAETTRGLASAHDGVVVVHGTDTLSVTGETLMEEIGELSVPVVLTGAIRPYIMRTSDALQNLVEAFLAVQLLGPGVYVVLHNKVLAFPGVTKDREKGTFIRDAGA